MLLGSNLPQSCWWTRGLPSLCAVSLPAVHRIQMCCSWPPMSLEVLSWGSLSPVDIAICRAPVWHRSTVGHLSHLCCIWGGAQASYAPPPAVFSDPTGLLGGDAREGFVAYQHELPCTEHLLLPLPAQLLSLEVAVLFLVLRDGRSVPSEEAALRGCLSSLPSQTWTSACP